MVAPRPVTTCAGPGCDRLIGGRHMASRLGVYPHRKGGMCVRCAKRAARVPARRRVPIGVLLTELDALLSHRTADDIADALGTTPETMWRKLYRARRQGDPLADRLIERIRLQRVT